mmetsp:Transcript_4195/g.14742  ORF Transcript_4195/g.14742 Transcript_4195/m.14742 type:complete len:282 (+) Transcript_4195:235-1080(+)
MRESSIRTLFIFLYASTAAGSSSKETKAKFSESPVFQSRTMSHELIRPNLEKMTSRSESSVTLLSLQMKSSFFGTSTSACGRSPTISRTSAWLRAFFSAIFSSRSSGVRPSSSSSWPPYCTRAGTASVGGRDAVGLSGGTWRPGGSSKGSSSACVCRMRTSSQGRPVSSRYSALMARRTSVPSAISPITVWPPASRCSSSSSRSVKKNCDPYLCRSPAPPGTLPMETIESKPKRSCGRRFAAGCHSINFEEPPSQIEEAEAPPRPVDVGSPVCARQRGWTL